MPPRVSVITPTKNRLALLREAMDSVERQTFEAWEHLIVDDGSDDGTAEEVARRAAADPRVRYVARSSAAAGANVCRNQGIAAAASDLIVFLDSDDLLEVQALERRLGVMDRNQDLDFATFQSGVFERVPGDLNREVDRDLSGDDLLRFLYFELPWTIAAPVWRVTALMRLGGFDEALPSWQDVDLHVRALTAGCRYLRFPEMDHHVRWQFEPTKVSVEQRGSANHLHAATPLIEKFERCVQEGPGMNWVRQRALCSLHYFVAERWVGVGDLPSALRSWKRIRSRSLGSRALHLSGAALLAAQSLGPPGRRLGGHMTHKWKGWVRLRTNPELVRR